MEYINDTMKIVTIPTVTTTTNNVQICGNKRKAFDNEFQSEQKLQPFFEKKSIGQQANDENVYCSKRTKTSYKIIAGTPPSSPSGSSSISSSTIPTCNN